MLEALSLLDKAVITSLILFKNSLWLEVADKEVSNFDLSNKNDVSSGEMAFSLQRPRWDLNQESNLDGESKSRLNFDHHLTENFWTNWVKEDPSHNGSVEKVQDEIHVISKTAQKHNKDL